MTGKPRVYFTKNDVKSSIKGNTLTMSSTQDLRAAIIEYWDPKKNITAIIVPNVKALIVIIV